jgi:hypothetical protein
MAEIRSSTTRLNKNCKKKANKPAQNSVNAASAASVRLRN